MNATQFAHMSVRANDIMGPFADRLLQQANFPPANSPVPLVVLDTACGSGVVASHIMSLLSPSDQARLDLTCADISESMITNLSSRIQMQGWTNSRAVIADAMDTKFESAHFSHVFFNFGPFILTDPLAGLRECHRILQPDGVLGFTTWKLVPWWGDYRDGIAMNPGLPAFPTDEELSMGFSETLERWNDVDEVRTHFEGCGFVDVDVQVAEHTTKLDGVKDVEAMMPYTLGMMIPKFWSKEQVEKYKAPAEDVVVKHLKDKYKDGQVVWRWISIIATGRKG